MTDLCEHVTELEPIAATANGCEACRRLGHDWHSLRVCLTCGHVGCCEDSPHAHALAHFNATGHPMIASFEPGESWGWCYVHQRYFDPLPVPIPKRRSAFRARLQRLLRRQRGS